jgi:hypothetical protein
MRTNKLNNTCSTWASACSFRIGFFTVISAGQMVVLLDLDSFRYHVKTVRVSRLAEDQHHMGNPGVKSGKTVGFGTKECAGSTLDS